MKILADVTEFSKEIYELITSENYANYLVREGDITNAPNNE